MKKSKILIIEDNDDIREGTTEILELSNYEVFQASNGKQGVEMAIKYLPDLILCDIMMPEMDGFGVLHLLSKNTDTSTIPFVFLTAKTERADMRKGMEMGADDYLTKPFDDVELFKAIESRLVKAEKQRNKYNQVLDRLSIMVAGNKGNEELKKLISEHRVRQIRKKQIIYYEGDTPNGIYLVVSGKVKTIKVAADGRELLTGMHGADEYFGVAALLANECYKDTAEATENTSLCLLPREPLEELLNKYPEVSGQFIKILADNVLNKEEQLLQLAYHSVRKRMAGVLLKMVGQKNADQISISRDNLAAMAGIATETVSRVLGDFKEEGLVERKGSIIIILNHLGLQNMKN